MILQVVGRLTGVRKGYNQPTNQPTNQPIRIIWKMVGLGNHPKTPCRPMCSWWVGILVEGVGIFFCLAASYLLYFSPPPPFLDPPSSPPPNDSRCLRRQPLGLFWYGNTFLEKQVPFESREKSTGDLNQMRASNVETLSRSEQSKKWWKMPDLLIWGIGTCAVSESEFEIPSGKLT